MYFYVTKKKSLQSNKYYKIQKYAFLTLPPNRKDSLKKLNNVRFNDLELIH